MKMWIFEKQSLFNVSRDTLFDWHERAGAFERLSPPWQKVKVLSQDTSLEEGAQVHLQLSMYGLIKLKWLLQHGPYKKGHLFVDTQLKGPFEYWKHEHQFLEKGPNQSILIDKITYRMKWGLGEKKLEQDLTRLFNYRHDVLKHDLATQTQYPTKTLKVAITGASGFIGQELTHLLTTAGHRVIPLTRHPKKPDHVAFDYHTGTFEAQALEGVGAVINLAGENIGSGRWHKDKKQRIYESRVLGTRLLIKGLNQLKNPPPVLISASGIGYYGNHPGQLVDEQSPAGKDFLAKVCHDWEYEALAYQKGRVVTPRLAMVLSPKAGALQKILLPARLGLAGVLGSGKQGTPWITIDDILYSFYHSLMNPSITGPINFVAGPPISNTTFIKALGNCLKRPTFLPLPSWVIKLLFAEMGQATLLSNVQAKSTHDIMSDNKLCYPYIDEALRHLCGK